MRLQTLKFLLLAVMTSGVTLAQSSGTGQQLPPQSTTPEASSPQQPSNPDPMTTTSAQSSRADATSSVALQSKIQSALQKDSKLATANINVNVSDATVELTGTVANQEQKKAAEEIAKQSAGGRQIKDQLKVSTQNNPFNPGPSDHLK